MNKKSYWSILFLTFVLLAIKSLSFNKPFITTHHLKNDLSHLLKLEGPHPSIGLMIKDVNSGHTLFSKNEDQYFMPASNQKIFTALAAFHFFPKDYTFDTVLDADLSGLQQGSLPTDVKLIFSGDPTFKIKDLNQLFKVLHQKGVTRIEKDIQVDLSVFDETPVSPGSSIEDVHYCWMAPLTSAILNKNCVAIWVKPHLKINEPIHLKTKDAFSNIEFKSNVLTYSKNHSPCIFDFKWSQNNTYELKGCLPQGSAEQKFEFANPKPLENLKLQIQHALSAHHIVLQGKVRFFKKKALKSTHPLAIHHSKPIGLLIKKMMKESDNLIANAIFKTLGAKHDQHPGDFQNGGLAVSQIIENQYGIKISPRAFIDGSGTSRYNFITPNQMIRVLEKTYHSPLREAFINTLPISGVDGSLKNRMKGPLLKGLVFAKTGSMSGVSSLSGYVKTPSGKTLAFTILINGYVNPISELKSFEDKLMAHLIDV